MTPAARFAAAIVVLDTIAAGEPAERALTNWARTNRFAGSGDRAAIRDHVYDVLRAKRSLAVVGGGTDARALILGLLRRNDIDPATVFGAGGHAPAALTDEETAQTVTHPTPAEVADLPDWLWPVWQKSLGPDALAVAQIQQHRAAVFLRVNLSRTSRAAAQASLLADGVATAPHTDVATALIVLDHPRRVAASATYLEGLIEVQDAASQAAIARLPVSPGMRILDYCAGGGGKALAIADRIGGPVWAHDIEPRRMADIGPRAWRAGMQITTLQTAQVHVAAPFDLVFCDAPCSGSGTWRRTPDAKWRLTAERLTELTRIQAEVLSEGAALTGATGVLAYATCSVLDDENEEIVEGFLARNPDWIRTDGLKLMPTADHDGFYLALLKRR